MADAIAIFVITYLFISTEKIHRVTAALGGVAALVIVGVIDAETAVFSTEAGVDWNVIFLVSPTPAAEFLEEVECPTLVFFMALFVLVGGFVRAGVIADLGKWAIEAVDGRYFLAATGLLFGSAVLGAFVDNATAQPSESLP